MKSSKDHIIADLVAQRTNISAIEIDESVKIKLVNLAAEALEIWNLVVFYFSKTERHSKVPSLLNEKSRMYAIDGLVIADLLEIPKKRRNIAVAVYTLYYLTVHYLDDIVDDSKKFHSKFAFDPNQPIKEQKKILGMSYMLHVMTTLSMLLTSSESVFTPIKSINIEREFCESLSKQIKYFILGKDKMHLPEIVREIKQHNVSGEATSFLASVLPTESFLSKNRTKHLRKALWYLGSLTQFTDDLRDYHRDKSQGNANLLISIEKFYGKEAIKTFTSWYQEEERLMLIEIKKVGITNTNDTAFLKAIPFHPFFLKSLINKA